MTMPSSPASESMVIAALHFHPELIGELTEILPEASMFTRATYAALYDGMLTLSKRQEPVDMMLAAEEAKVSPGEAAEVLTKLPSDLWLYAASQKPQVLSHARLIQHAWVKREAMRLADRQDGAEALLAKLGELSKAGSDRSYSSEDLAMLLITESTDHGQRLDYPFYAWQWASGGGLRMDELVIVAGRPATGKSAVLGQWAWQLAAQGKQVLFASAEMSALSLTKRIASHITGRNLVNPKGQEDTDALNEAADQISRSGLQIHELTNVSQLTSLLRQAQTRYDIVFVDYLQQLSPSTRATGEFEVVTAVTRELDALSMKYALPFVVASQFSRAADKARPTMADLRSSGQIEQAADVIISLYSNPDEPEVAGKTKVYFDILKNRNGMTLRNSETTTHALWFDKPRFTFRSMEDKR